MASTLDLLVQCPPGTKFWILNLGYLSTDAGWAVQGAGSSSKSNLKPDPQRSTGQLYAILIAHPQAGLILWETGGGKKYEVLTGFPANDIFYKVDEDASQDLDAQIALTGHKVSDIKMVVLGHLHADHAGGLEEFFGTDVPIYIHEKELKNAYYSIATKTDAAVYKSGCLPLDLNWVPIYGDSLEVAQGITLHHAPGHTPGLMVLQVNLPDTGTWIATSDMYLVAANYEANLPLGWLARDHHAWVQSHQMIKHLARRTSAKMLFGHDAGVIAQYQLAPHAYT